MSKNSLIGGIYNKPLLTGNTLHFLTASMAMIKLTLKFENNLQLIIPHTIIYFLFTLFFGYVFFLIHLRNHNEIFISYFKNTLINTLLFLNFTLYL